VWKTYKAIVLQQINFGGLKASNILTFAAPLTETPVANRILLGLNTLNYWDYEINRSENLIQFSESAILPLGANIKNKYTSYFDIKGNYVLMGQ
jgi:hypothetical protein